MWKLKISGGFFYTAMRLAFVAKNGPWSGGTAENYGLETGFWLTIAQR
jgi:hypothetical protein